MLTICCDKGEKMTKLLVPIKLLEKKEKLLAIFTLGCLDIYLRFICNAKFTISVKYGKLYEKWHFYRI